MKPLKAVIRHFLGGNPSEEILFADRELLQMTVPYILSFALSLLVGMLDTVMVSSVGDAAVSGVSLVDNIFQLLVFVFSAFGTGGAVIAGQYLGNRQDREASECTEQLLWLSALAALILTAAVYLGRRGILALFFGKIGPEVSREALIYLGITAFSLPAMALYEGAVASIRALGEARAVLRISLVMNGVNILGNALLIYGLHWGTAGAAWPTLLSRWIAAGLAVLFFLPETRRIHFARGRRPALRGSLILKILKVGAPNGIENGIFQLGKLLTLRMIAAFGTAAIAANAVAVILTNIVSVPGWGINNTAMTVVSRCVGKKDLPQARYFQRILTAVATAMFVVWAGLIILALPLILGLFGNLTPEARSLAGQMVRVHALGTVLVWVPAFLTPAALRAAGDVNFAMMVSILSMWIFRVGFAFFLTRGTAAGPAGVWIAMVLDWCFRAVLFTGRWRGKKWESKRVI